MSANTSTESSSTYSLVGRGKNFINNESLSDICFLVGQSDNAKKIYGHKLFLAMGSPVFEKMFFGDLPEKKDLIVIPELTAVGFMNIIRYIYAEQVDFELNELHETYMAANMYMVYDLCDKIRNFIDKKLNEANIILIFEQLMKIKNYDPLIDDLFDKVRCSIDKSAFNNKYFNKISEEMLIDILNIECLDVEEALILKSCFNWINESKSTIEDKKASFKKIKPYIDFSRITFVDDLKLFTEIDSFLDQDEIANLLMFLMDKKRPYPFELKTKRGLVLNFNSSRIQNGFKVTWEKKSFYSINFSVNRDILIKSIETSLPFNNLEVRFLSNKETFKPIFFKVSQNDKLTLVFSKFLIIKANLEYLIELNHHREILYPIQNFQTDPIEYGGINFSFKFISGYEFIKQIKFVNCECKLK